MTVNVNPAGSNQLSEQLQPGVCGAGDDESRWNNEESFNKCSNTVCTHWARGATGKTLSLCEQIIPLCQTFNFDKKTHML